MYLLASLSIKLSMLQRVRARAPWKSIDDPLGRRVPRLRTNVLQFYSFTDFSRKAHKTWRAHI